MLLGPGHGCTLVDWEFGGQYLAGYGLATLYVLFGDAAPEMRHRIDAAVASAGMGAEFCVNLACILVRELRIHGELDGADTARSRLPGLEAAWARGAAGCTPQQARHPAYRQAGGRALPEARQACGSGARNPAVGVRLSRNDRATVVCRFSPGRRPAGSVSGGATPGAADRANVRESARQLASLPWPRSRTGPPIQLPRAVSTSRARVPKDYHHRAPNGVTLVSHGRRAIAKAGGHRSGRANRGRHCAGTILAALSIAAFGVSACSASGPSAASPSNSGPGSSRNPLTARTRLPSSAAVVLTSTPPDELAAGVAQQLFRSAPVVVVSTEDPAAVTSGHC